MSFPFLTHSATRSLVNEASLAAARDGAAHISAHMLDRALDKISMGTERR